MTGCCNASGLEVFYWAEFVTPPGHLCTRLTLQMCLFMEFSLIPTAVHITSSCPQKRSTTLSKAAPVFNTWCLALAPGGTTLHDRMWLWRFVAKLMCCLRFPCDITSSVGYHVYVLYIQSYVEKGLPVRRLANIMNTVGVCCIHTLHVVCNGSIAIGDCHIGGCHMTNQGRCAVLTPPQVGEILHSSCCSHQNVKIVSYNKCIPW